MEDVEPFLEWLRGRGLTDQAHLDAYRRFATELAKHPSLSAALRAAEEAGTPAREIANMRQVAMRMAEFKSAAEGTDIPLPPPKRTPAAPGPALEVEPRGIPLPTPALDVEPRTPRSSSTSPLGIEPKARTAASAATRDMSARRKGCICNRRHDAYLDDDFGALARLFGGGIGIGTFVLIRLIGVLGALTLALGAAGMGGLVTITSISFRCEGCRHKVGDLDDDERARVRKGRSRVVLITAALIVGAAVCGAMWWSLIRSAHRNEY